MDRPGSAQGGSGPSSSGPKLSHSATVPATLHGHHRKAGTKGRKSQMTDTFPSRRSSNLQTPKHGGGGGGGGGGSGSGGGADPASKTHRKPLKLTIRDIVDNDTGKRPTSKNLIKGLEDNVRKVLEIKRNEYDRVHFQLRAKKKELAEMELKLADLSKDGAALGLDEYPNESERLRPVKAISTRPVFTKHTRLEEMVATLEKKKEQIQKVVHTGKIYDHMRHRLMHQRVQAKAINRDLKIELRKLQLRNKELRRDEMAITDSLNNAQTRLAQLKRRVARDLELWQSEIQDLEGWAKQKAKFETFVQKQIDLQREIELEAQGDMAEDEEDVLKAKNAASMFANRHMARKLSTSIKASSDEEQRYEDAFRKIGVKLDQLDPKTIIETCIAQDEIRKDLLQKRAAEEERVESLKEQLAVAQQELQKTMFDQERTTNRVLSDREKELQEAIKQLEAERSEFQFMQSTVQPVKIGIQHLAKKVLDVQVDLSDIAEIEWVMNQIQHKLAKIIEETRQDVGTVRTATPGAASGPDSSQRRMSLSLAGLTDAEANASWLMSPYNCRVKPARKDDYEGDTDSEDEADSRGKKKAKARAKLADDDDSDSDEDVSNKVHKRDDIKKMAEMSAMKHRKSRHRKQQGTDIVKAQERATSRLTRR